MTQQAESADSACCFVSSDIVYDDVLRTSIFQSAFAGSASLQIWLQSTYSLLSTSVYAPEGGRTLIGIDDDGEVRSVMLDLPVHKLFRSFAGTEPCGDEACIYELLMDSVVSKEEFAAEGR